MKSIKYFIIALAGLSMIACTSEEGVNKTVSNEAKSVTLRIDGLSNSGKLRSIDNETTAAHTITLNDLTLVFTDGSTVYQTVELSATANPEDFTAIQDEGVTYHLVNPAVTKVLVIGNNSVDKGISLASVADIRANLVNPENEQGKENVTLYGEGNLVPDPTDVHQEPHPNTVTEHYKTEVVISPLVARFEIGSIKCTNLDTDYTSFVLKGIGLVDVYPHVTLDGTNFGSKLTVYTSANMGGNFYAPGGPSPAADEIEFGTLPWAYETINDALLDNSTFTYGPEVGKVFAFNFIAKAGDFPNVKIRLGNVTPKTSLGYANYEYVSTLSFTGVDATHPKPGYIYLFDLEFTESNIGPWDPESKKCVVVTVRVIDWEIVPVTPVFH